MCVCTKVRFEASLLEIYNEKVLDLLADPKAAAGGGAEPLEVRVASDGAVSVVNQRAIPVGSTDDVHALMQSGCARRHTSATLMNDASSRSHLVLTIATRCINTLTRVEKCGKLHLVDLAGSERVGKSGVTGEHLKEAQHINKSLSSLEQVMLALQARQDGKSGTTGAGSHVPYRNSKLTLLLSDALGAKGACAKTIMIMQVSPSPTSCPETARTLKFGERCQSVCLGAVKRTTGTKPGSSKGVEGGMDERAAKLQADVLEARKALKDAEVRGRAAESRADALSERLRSTQALLAAAKEPQQPQSVQVKHPAAAAELSLSLPCTALQTDSKPEVAPLMISNSVCASGSHISPRVSTNGGKPTPRLSARLQVCIAYVDDRSHIRLTRSSYPVLRACVGRRRTGNLPRSCRIPLSPLPPPPRLLRRPLELPMSQRRL